MPLSLYRRKPLPVRPTSPHQPVPVSSRIPTGYKSQPHSLRSLFMRVSKAHPLPPRQPLIQRNINNDFHSQSDLYYPHPTSQPISVSSLLLLTTIYRRRITTHPSSNPHLHNPLGPRTPNLFDTVPRHVARSSSQ
uniref:Uncharacterized protein n=1 Tax=Knipowitschia caucasica TaxID=637954 RepID=A0AAV2K5D8_KNICA